MISKVSFTISIWLLIIFTGTLFAAPAITGVSGTKSHGQSITISGSGFGTKSPAAPLVWDNGLGADGTAPSGYSGYYGTYSGSNAGYSIQYHSTGFRSVSGPHSHSTKYLAGCALGYGYGGPQGVGVLVYKNYNLSSTGYLYESFYQRFDPSYHWTGGVNDNIKSIWIDTGYADVSSGGMELTWYYPAGSGGWFSYAPYSPTYSQQTNHDARTAWVHDEVINYENGASGQGQLYEDGQLVFSLSKSSSAMSGSSRCTTIGGYTSYQNDPGNNVNNFRYLSDIYIDNTLSRVVIGNASSYSSCTRRAMQPPTAWNSSGGSITVTVNQDNFGDGSTAYLYVFDSTGAVNSTGYEIQFGTSGGGTTDTTSPAVPSGVAITIVQ
jgi:hypothetical protein